MKTKELCEPCSKIRYPTWRKAVHEALAHSGIFGRAFRAYRCPKDAGWHLTTKPAR